MKIAEIDWPLFWQALKQQRFSDRQRWLARWVFADDSVRLSMRPTAEKVLDKSIIDGERLPLIPSAETLFVGPDVSGRSSGNERRNFRASVLIAGCMQPCN